MTDAHAALAAGAKAWAESVAPEDRLKRGWYALQLVTATDAHPDRIVGEWNATWRPEPPTEATREALARIIGETDTPWAIDYGAADAILKEFNVTPKELE